MPHDKQTGTILLVEDDVDIRELVKRYLKTAGYPVAAAADGEEGFRLYQEHQSSIGLLLTDVTMPNLSGPDLADLVLGIDSELPVLFMSGAGTAWNSHRGLDCLTKPFWPSELIETVSRMLKAKSHSQTAAPAAWVPAEPRRFWKDG